MSFASLNVSNFVTLRLRPENYPLWREQVLALAESQELTDFLTGENPCPAVVLPALDEEALSHVIGLDTSAQVWATLKEAYAQSSQERKFQLNQQLTYMKKTQEVSLNEYIRKFKEDLVHIMNPSLHQCLNHQCHPIMRFNHSIQPDNLPQVFTALQLNSEAHHEEWTSDTGTSTHMTSNEGNLHNLKPYTGNDHVMLGNGEFLKGTHTGDALLGFGQSAIVLRNVLLVLMRRLKMGHLYAIRAPPVALFSSRFRVASKDI
ncbi:hypothetical protein Patl1_32914 [Pistacia atlantica]|uniref:Uncharacterized protein n=1 Tax=Pistacia atlantica TaxID=434234 RepID=A0ACC1APL3_9ROSI|nr:hypothetical protein Patl1_32914 [Pistacia atlantica]